VSISKSILLMALIFLDILGIGLIGSMQNIIAAGVVRKDGTPGIHLTVVETVRADEVEKVLREVKQKYPSAGSSLEQIHRIYLRPCQLVPTWPAAGLGLPASR
jgi:hypothetical protein